MLDKDKTTTDKKRDWKTPEIKDFGKIEEVTQKSLGAFDGSGLENVVHHPSM